ncbi:hypothetical protein GQ457_13G008840 [Hibiscus cannabinus]
MAREGRCPIWGLGSGLCSYKIITLIVCSLNIFIALSCLRSLYSSPYIYSNKDYGVVKHTPDHIRKMEKSVRIRRANEPIELVKLVNQLKPELWGGGSMPLAELPQAVKNKITEEILQRLRNLRPNATVSEEQEAVQAWRREKLKEAKMLADGGKGLNSTLLQEEAGNLVKVLESDWTALSEEIGLWIPTGIENREHNDKPEGVEDAEDVEQILAGRPLPPECNLEIHTDYDGECVQWGLSNPQESAADCCQACLDQAKSAKPDQKKCNIWVYCPSESGCYSPDTYEHKHMECWLKYSEKPSLNFKDRYSEEYRNSHSNVPVIVPWVSGVIRV